MPTVCTPCRTLRVALCAILASLGSGCGPEPSNLTGKIYWVHLAGAEYGTEGPLNGVFGAAFLLLEEHYDSLGFEGPPEGFPTTSQDSVEWHRHMPEAWWTEPALVHEWWGRQSGPEPAEVTLHLDVPVHLLRAHLDSRGNFEFNNLPRGRHTLFIRWGKNPDPQNNISGPYEVIINEAGKSERVIPVSAFDLIDT